MALSVTEASAVNDVLDALYPQAQPYPRPHDPARTNAALVTLAAAAHKRLAAGWTGERVAAEQLRMPGVIVWQGTLQ